MPEPVPDTDQTDTPVDQTQNNVPDDLMAPLDPAARGSIITIPAVPLGPSSMVPDPVDSAFAAFNEGLMGVPELEQELVDIEVGFMDIEADRQGRGGSSQRCHSQCQHHGQRQPRQHTQPEDRDHRPPGSVAA